MEVLEFYSTNKSKIKPIFRKFHPQKYPPTDKGSFQNKYSINFNEDTCPNPLGRHHRQGFKIVHVRLLSHPYHILLTISLF